MWNLNRCLGCGSCVEVCSEDSIIFNGHLQMNESLCNLCMRCVENCYPGALELVGQDMTVDEVIA